VIVTGPLNPNQGQRFDWGLFFKNKAVHFLKTALFFKLVLFS